MVATELEPSQQILDAVDEVDQVVGTVRRADVFRLRTNFRVAHLFLFNKRGEILLQRLAVLRKRHPGCWGSSVAAYVTSGETYAEAISRRAHEELGIQVEDLEFLGKTSMSDGGCTKFISVFSGRCNGPLAVDTSHIAEVRFVSLPDVVQAREMEAWNFTPTFVQLADLYLDPSAGQRG